MKTNNLKVLATCLFILTSFVFSGYAQQSMTGTMDKSMEPAMEESMDTMNEQKMETPIKEKTEQNMGDTRVK